MKFAHLGDCHLGSWRQPELKELNFRSFQEAVKISIKEKVDFILIAGDLFDSAYPPIDTLKEAFEEFKKIHDAKIPVFLIAGSHDYSVSGKTFLDVLEKAGFCKNVFKSEEKDGKIILEPTIYKNVAIYGFPGRKSGLEVEEIERIKLQDSPGLFKILMLHTAIQDAVNNLMIKAVNEKTLPKVDYLALAHLHINYKKENRVYCGPTFPNNISELEELKHGSFYIFDNGQIKKEEINLKEVLAFAIEIQGEMPSTDDIISVFAKNEIKDKIIILRLTGILEKGKISDLDFQKLESFLKNKGAFSFLKSTSRLHIAHPELKMEIIGQENIEHQLIKQFQESGLSGYNSLTPTLINSLSVEKKEDETRLSFEGRILSETTKFFGI